MNQIEWRAHGFEGSRLGYLLNGIGLFHRSHRAVDDCYALLEILAHTIPSADRTALSLLRNTSNLKGSIKSRRLKAGWSEPTLEAVVFGTPL